LTDLIVEGKGPIADVLKNIEGELLQVGQLLARLQITFSPLLHTAACTNEFFRDVQLLDLVAQQIQQLTVVMSNLASTVAPEWLVASKDVAAEITLQALANRICARTMADGNDKSGSFELL